MKRVGEIIKNGHKKFTYPYRECKWCDSVTLSLCHSVTFSLCHSVTLCAINGLISLPPFIRLAEIFLRLFGQKCMSQKKILSQGPGGRGQKMSDLSSFLSYLTRYRSKKLKLWSKINKIGMDRFQDCCKAEATNALLQS